MDDKIIIDRMGAEEFLSMLTDAAMQGDNVTQYYSTTQIIENIANEFKDLCKL
jgi:phage terminase large subunit-like protein